jgi:hypothetical protein
MIVFLGVSLEDATNLNYLQNLLRSIELKVKDLHQTQSKTYASKQQKQDLEVKVEFKTNFFDENY